MNTERDLERILGEMEYIKQENIKYENLNSDFNSKNLFDKMAKQVKRRFNYKKTERGLAQKMKQLIHLEMPFDGEYNFDYEIEPLVCSARKGGLNCPAHFQTVHPNEFLRVAPPYNKTTAFIIPGGVKEKIDLIRETGKIKVGYIRVERDNSPFQNHQTQHTTSPYSMNVSSGALYCAEHEGRHTMAACKVLGIHRVPLLIMGKFHYEFSKKTHSQY